MAVAAVAALVPCLASAQDTLPGGVVLGLYFGAEEDITDVSILTATSVEAYLVITEATSQLIDGWEIKMTMTGGAMVTDVAVPLGTTMTSMGPENWVASLANPLPANPRTKLASFTIYSSAEDDVFIFLGAVDGGAAGGSLPAVRLTDGNWYGVEVPSGDPTLPVAGIDSTTPNDQLSFGSVKSLFR